MPFATDKIEDKVVAKIFKREFNLLAILRSFDYGKFIVHKQNDKITRVEASKSILITEREGHTLDD